MSGSSSFLIHSVETGQALSERSSYCSSEQSNNGKLIRSSCSFISVIWLSFLVFLIANASRKISWFLFVVKCKGFILLLAGKPCFLLANVWQNLIYPLA